MLHGALKSFFHAETKPDGPGLSDSETEMADSRGRHAASARGHLNGGSKAMWKASMTQQETR